MVILGKQPRLTEVPTPPIEHTQTNKKQEQKLLSRKIFPAARETVITGAAVSLLFDPSPAPRRFLAECYPVTTDSGTEGLLPL